MTFRIALANGFTIPAFDGTYTANPNTPAEREITPTDRDTAAMAFLQGNPDAEIRSIEHN